MPSCSMATRTGRSGRFDLVEDALLAVLLELGRRLVGELPGDVGVLRGVLGELLDAGWRRCRCPDFLAAWAKRSSSVAGGLGARRGR